MKRELNNLIVVLNNIVKGFKNINLDGCLEPSQVTVAYRSIFGNEYKDINKEIIAKKLSEKNEWKAFYSFLNDKDCLWMDFIGCDSFSDNIKKQIFFATISMDDNVAIARKDYLDAYKKKIKDIPIDLYIQLFFIDKERLLSGLKDLGNIEEEIIKNLGEKLDIIQSNGFVLSFSSKQKCTSDKDLIILNVNVNPFDSIDSFEKETNLYKEHKISFPSEIKNLLESFEYYKPGPEVTSGTKPTTQSDLSNFIARFNRSLHRDIKFLYFVPNHCPDGSVGMFCFGSKANDLLDSSIIDELRLLSYNLLYPYVSSYKSAWENERVVKESMKSAISAIMSRNMSHNLGSHCMHYTKAALEDLANKTTGHGPEIRGAAKLIGYIQGRMDFLATLVSGEMYSYGTVNFKSQLLDVLTVDDFSKRHFKKSSEWEKYTVIKKNEVRQSMQALAKQLKAIIEEENENNPIEQKKVVDATSVLIKDLNSLVIDNAELRTTNYLLENLIKSEHFYRKDIFDEQNDKNLKGRQLIINVRYNGNLFTGSEYLIEEESSVKNQLSQINVAMPGGVMSAHAFFNIIENLIRNSAKHRAEDLRDSLTTTIDIRSVKKDQEPYLRFTIYDNKHNAGIVYPIIVEQLKSLRILGEANSLDKKSKGLKEMLVATLWLRANEFDTNYSDLIYEIEKETEGEKKIKLIKQYAFEFVKVDDHGNSSVAEDSNLGLTFVLPCFETSMSLTFSDNNQVLSLSDLIKEVKNRKFRADIVDVIEATLLDPVRRYFTRVYNDADSSLILSKQIQYRIIKSVCEKNEGKLFEDTMKLYAIMRRRFGKKLSHYRIVFGSSDPNASIIETSDSDNVIYFQRHLNKKKDFDRTQKFLYADSISGGNFTVTLMENYENGHTPDNKSRTWIDKYFELKIIESALTRITLIDERLSDNYNAFELMMKNIRVLNINPNSKNEVRCWIGNKFKDNRNYTHFLSIHLGLIEKMINNENNWFYHYYNETFKDIEDKPDKAKVFMNYLRRKFGSDKEIFICIHSGRGNYSYDLEHSLSEYPFLNLSAIESVFSNSKYMLAQLFYNTIYIGKGDYNKK